MRPLHTTCIKGAGIAAALCGVLCQPAKADLRAITQSDDIEGSRIELRSPDGYTCRFTDTERPSLTVGAGVAPSPVIPGYGIDGDYTPGRLGGPQPVVGVVLRVPLGSSPDNCKQIIAVETAAMKVRRAQELYDLGLITLEQFKEVGDKAFAVISGD